MPAPQQADQQQRPAKQEAPKTTYEDIGDGAVSGNITRDPELRFTPQGRAIVTLRVAETERVSDGQGSWKDGETSFWDVIAWGDMGVHASEALRRGDRIAAVGRWQKQMWRDDQGEPRSKTVLVARDMGPSLLFREVTIVRDQKRGNKP